MVQPVTTLCFYAAVPAYLPLLALAQSTIIKPLTVSIHIIVWLKRLKARGSESAALRLSANLFGFLQLTRLFRFQFGDFRFQRLFNHRGREDFFFARTDNYLTIGNVR